MRPEEVTGPGGKIQGRNMWKGVKATIASLPYKDRNNEDVFDLIIEEPLDYDLQLVKGKRITSACTNWEWEHVIGKIYYPQVSPPKAHIRQEKPCQVCGRDNDLGVKKCWHCDNVPH